MSKAFRDNDFKKHRENILLEREKSFLPATIPFVEQEVKRRALRVKNAELAATRNALLEKIKNIDVIFYKNLNLITNRRLNEGDDINDTERRTFIRACVMADC